MRNTRVPKTVFVHRPTWSYPALPIAYRRTLWVVVLLATWLFFDASLSLRVWIQVLGWAGLFVCVFLGAAMSFVERELRRSRRAR